MILMKICSNFKLLFLCLENKEIDNELQENGVTYSLITIWDKSFIVFTIANSKIQFKEKLKTENTNDSQIENKKLMPKAFSKIRLKHRL